MKEQNDAEKIYPLKSFYPYNLSIPLPLITKKVSCFSKLKESGRLELTGLLFFMSVFLFLPFPIAGIFQWPAYLSFSELEFIPWFYSLGNYFAGSY